MDYVLLTLSLFLYTFVWTRAFKSSNLTNTYEKVLVFFGMVVSLLLYPALLFTAMISNRTELVGMFSQSLMLFYFVILLTSPELQRRFKG